MMQTLNRYTKRVISEGVNLLAAIQNAPKSSNGGLFLVEADLQGACRATIVEVRDKPKPQVKVSIYGNPVWLDSSPKLLNKARGLIGQPTDVSATFDRCQLDSSTLGGQLRSIRALADSDTVKAFDDWFASLPLQEWCVRKP